MVNVNQLENGTLISWPDESYGRMFGVFVKLPIFGKLKGFTNLPMDVKVSFQDGLPTIVYAVGDYDLVSKNQLIANLEGIATALKTRSEDELFTNSCDTQSLLYSAFISRQEDMLRKTIRGFYSCEDSISFAKNAIKEDTEGTGTGIYVARGNYSGQGRSKHFSCVELNPRISEIKALKMLYKKFPNGFSTIPREVNHTVATSHGDLVGYDVLEVPQNKVDLVKDIVRLTEGYH